MVYNDEQISNDEKEINKEIKEKFDNENFDSTVNTKESFLSDIAFGIKCLEIFSPNNKQTKECYFKFLRVFNYENLPEDEYKPSANMSPANRICFILRLVDNILDFLKTDISGEQKSFLYSTLYIISNVIKNICNSN